MNNVLEEAKKLREQGLSYPQIVKTLEGKISLDQCKRNLKGVKKAETNDEALLKELIALSTRPEGCTNYEANALIYQHKRGETVTMDDTKNIRKKVKRRSKDVLFREPWMDVNYPNDSLQLLCQLADNISQRIEEAAEQYVQEFPNTPKKVVMRELVHLSNNFTCPEIVGKRLKRYAEQAELVSYRVADDQDGIALMFAPPTLSGSKSADVTDLNCRDKISPMTEEEEKIWEVPY